jgi:hypothetical protein
VQNLVGARVVVKDVLEHNAITRVVESEDDITGPDRLHCLGGTVDVFGACLLVVGHALNTFYAEVAHCFGIPDELRSAPQDKSASRALNNFEFQPTYVLVHYGVCLAYLS